MNRGQFEGRCWGLSGVDSFSGVEYPLRVIPGELSAVDYAGWTPWCRSSPPVSPRAPVYPHIAAVRPCPSPPRCPPLRVSPPSRVLSTRTSPHTRFLPPCVIFLFFFFPRDVPPASPALQSRAPAPLLHPSPNPFASGPPAPHGPRAAWGASPRAVPFPPGQQRFCRCYRQALSGRARGWDDRRLPHAPVRPGRCSRGTWRRERRGPLRAAGGSSEGNRALVLAAEGVGRAAA